MGYVLKHEAELNGQKLNFYVPLKLKMTTSEKEKVKHFFYGSACCQETLLTESKCGKCGQPTERVKVYPQGKPEETGSSDMWNIQEIDFADIDLPRTTKWKWLELGKLKKPKASEVQQMREYVKLKNMSGKNLEELFKYLAVKRKALLGDIVFREGKVNQFFIKPHRIGSRATLLMGILDGNLETIEPTEQYTIAQVQEVAQEKEVIAE